MPTTELLNPPVIDDSKPPAPRTLPIPERQPPPVKGALAPRKRAKWWLAASLVVLLAAAVTYYFRGSSQPAYVTATIDRGDIEAAITATGTVNAVKTVQVGSQVSGNILDLYADFNTKVKQGQLVARIDPAIFQARVDQTRAAQWIARKRRWSALAPRSRKPSRILRARKPMSPAKKPIWRTRRARWPTPNSRTTGVSKW